MSTVTPAQLAAALGMPAPTAEQAAVITAPLGPSLVIAGAGAGKTETMAARVVWLVANRHVAPDQVLGLTFTRKAAQQLGTRIRTRLQRLAGSRLVRDLDPSLDLRALLLAAEPEVGTYHAYAGRLLAEHGLLLPVEPAATVLTETQMWQLAHRVVSTWDGELDTERAPTTITEAVLALSGQLAEHLVEPDELREAHTELDKLVHGLPPGPKQKGGPTKALLDIVDVQAERVHLLPLVERLRAALRARGALDFGSQMSLAARLAADYPAVGKAQRQQFRVVLLDEYQDTGHAQRVLLASLFGGGVDRTLALTAVGDPMQSIYGWRGASAANLPRFTTDFPRAPGKPAAVLELSTSWRNPPEVLELANAVAAPLREQTVAVAELRARPGAPAAKVRLALTDTVESERAWIAAQIAHDYEAGERPPTAAVLVRRNADAAPMAEALRQRGLPVEIVGLGGLLHTPEVADVVAMLRLVADPASGSAAVRVLTGARWRIGLTDLRALWQRAAELSIVRPPVTGEGLVAAVGATLPGEPAERAGLADAVADPGAPQRYSAAGYERIGALGKQLAHLRERIGQPLSDLVADVERTIGIRAEARREHLDAFADVVAGYAGDPEATVGGLLDFLRAAESVENGLEPGEVEVAPDRVQVLTVHAAKGLEWEIVAVPHVAKNVFPSGVNAGTWLGALGELPPALRGDRATDGGDGVPVLELSEVFDRSQLDEALSQHKAALARRRAAEDRRLFYVALTRTERTLYVSAHHWAETGRDPKGPSEFLLELKDAVGQVDRWDEPPEPGAANPFRERPVTAQWPRDPLGPRRAAVEAGAAAVLAALRELPPEAAADRLGGADGMDGGARARREEPVGDAAAALNAVPEEEWSPEVAAVSEEEWSPEVAAAPAEEWSAQVDALLAERAAHEAETEVELPAQLSVSQLVELRADPDALAARLRRPLPFRPNPFARRGTAFHAWLERHFGATRLLDLDELPGAADTGAVDHDLVALQDAFLNSPWAQRSPVEVEVPFETVLAGTVIRGRIDAVFADPGGGWTVVDWKTGAPPAAGAEAAVAYQLAVYRIAWARLAQCPLEQVRAAFHYVRSGRTIAPEQLPDEQAVAALIATAGTPEAPQG